jgi:hypothetical protein
MKKISDYKVGDPVNFSFLGEHKTGVVLEVLPKENKLVVKTDRGIIHQVRSSEKESQFCYLI